MRVGVGLPTAVPCVDGRLILDWAREAERHKFSTLGAFDRLAYDSWDPLIALAAAASVTSRIGLATAVLNGPLYNTVTLAKALASLDLLSNGRLVVGLAIGARETDYAVAGVDARRRGQRLTEQLLALRTHWEEGRLGPRPTQAGGPRLLVGGLSDAAFARLARYAHGYLHGGGPPQAFARSAEKARAAWTDAGRPDKLHLWGTAYFALGQQEVEAGSRYLKDYYAFTGPFAEKVVAGLLTSSEALREFVLGYREAGCDELLLFPTVADPGQVTRLAEAFA